MLRRFGIATVGAVGMVMTSVTLAFATTPEGIVGSAAEGLKDSLFAVAVAILPYAALLAAVVIGWRLARKFVKA